jgi:hypothetical protein
MNANAVYPWGLHTIVRRALEGRLTPVIFLLILGFFSTLVLLYISLHVYFFNISNTIVASSERVDALIDSNVRLMAAYNYLAAPARIIPLAQELGLRTGSTDEVQRLALRFDAKSDHGEPSWAQAKIENLLEFGPLNSPGTK